MQEGIGWRRISDELHAASGVRVSYEALRSWYVSSKAASSEDAA